MEADVEKLVEKGMDNHEESWKTKFTAKKDARIEIKKLKHSQRLEKAKLKQNNKNWLQKINEDKRKIKEMELAEKVRKERQERKWSIIKSIITGIGVYIFFVFIAIMAILEG